MAREVEQAATVQLFQIRAAAFGLFAACAASADPTPTFSPPPAVTAPDSSVELSPGSRPYVTAQVAAYESAAPVVRAPARVAFRDGAVSQINVPVAGRVTAVHVSTGDRVKAGDPLLTLSSPEAAATRAQLAAAMAEHEAARQEAARQDQMAAAGVGIASERVAAQAKLKQSEAELARAQTTTGILGGGGGSAIVLRAPIDGTVISRRASVGSVAASGGDPLIEIGNPTALWVVADVFERDLVQVHEGAEVELEIGPGDKPLLGKVASIGSAMTGSLRTAPVYIALDAAATDALRAGMYARATIKAAAGQSIVLPAEAVLVKSGKRSVVYVEQADKRFAPRDVTVGRSVDGRVQVLSGVFPGDRVVVKGALLLDGAAEQLL